MKNILGFYLKPYYGRMAWGIFIKFTGTIMRSEERRVVKDCK